VTPLLSQATSLSGDSERGSNGVISALYKSVSKDDSFIKHLIKEKKTQAKHIKSLTAKNRSLRAQIAALKRSAPAACTQQQPQQQVMHEHEVQFTRSASSIGEPEQLSGRCLLRILCATALYYFPVTQANKDICCKTGHV
jgi:hypothetical protein